MSWTIGLTHIVSKGKLQAWLIQDGVTLGKDWEWRTVVSGEDAKDSKEALSIALNRYRAGDPSEVFKTKTKTKTKTKAKAKAKAKKTDAKEEAA